MKYITNNEGNIWQIHLKALRQKVSNSYHCGVNLYDPYNINICTHQVCLKLNRSRLTRHWLIPNNFVTESKSWKSSRSNICEQIRVGSIIEKIRTNQKKSTNSELFIVENRWNLQRWLENIIVEYINLQEIKG